MNVRVPTCQERLVTQLDLSDQGRLCSGGIRHGPKLNKILIGEIIESDVGTDHYFYIILVTNDAGLGAVRNSLIIRISSANEVFSNVGSAPIFHPVSRKSPGRASPLVICPQFL